MWLAGVGLLLVAIPGLWMYMMASAEPLHPNPRDVPSVPQRAAAPPKWTGAVEQAREIVRSALSTQNLPGISVAVGMENRVVWAEGFGFADVEQRMPVTPDHRFRIGTASTVLTSAAAGLLLEEGRLKLDEPIQTYVPAFPAKERPVTLRQLMAHTAGLRSDGGDEGPLFAEHCERPVEALPHFADRALLFEPGTKFRFSRYGWIVVSAAIEAVIGKPFLTFIRERIFGPLDMRGTVPDPGPKPAPGRATYYFPRMAADPTYGLHLMRDLDYSCYSGASVFESTPSDLVRFGMAAGAGKLLKPSTVALLQTSQKLPSGQETGYGLGWDLETVTIAGKPAREVGHDGDSLGGMVASLITLPEHGIVVAVICNISYAGTFSLAVKLAEAFAQPSTTPAPPQPRRRP